MNEKDLLKELIRSIKLYLQGKYSKEIIVAMFKVAIQKLEDKID